MPADPIRVLFVCTHNSARSQIAEALLQRYGGDDFEVFSAGTEVTQVNPYARRVDRGRRHRLERRPEQVDHRVPGPALRLRHHGLRPRPGHLPGLPRIDRTRSTGASTIHPRSRAPTRRSWPRSGGPRPRSRPGSARSSRCPPSRGPTQAPGPRLRAAAAESLGTFALVFFGCGAIANGLSPTSVALAFGLVIAVMVYALGHISGAHFNPAVSIAFAVGRHGPWSRTGAYVVAQVLGADRRRDRSGGHPRVGVDLGVTHPTGSDLQAFVWEAILTFVLMLVITAVATDVRPSGRRPRSRSAGRSPSGASSAGRSAAHR